MAEDIDETGYNAGFTGPGLDMTHGFVSHIRKNQINRDDYDKEVKQTKKNQRPARLTPAPTRPRKPDMNRYMPPTTTPAKEMHCDNEPAPALDELVLFKLEYEDQDGDISKLLVLKDDDPREVAAEFAQECGIHDSLVDALAYRIDQEMKKRST